jgi:hypothetical protein
VRQRAALGVLQVGQQRPGGRVGGAQAVGVDALQAGDAELLAEFARAQGGLELPGRPGGERAAQRRQRLDLARGAVIAGQQQFGRRQPRQPARQLGGGAFGSARSRPG